VSSQRRVTHSDVSFQTKASEYLVTVELTSHTYTPLGETLCSFKAVCLHRHVFADGWSTSSHKRKMTLLEAPTGTLLFYYKDIKQDIVHTSLLEEYGVSRKISNHHGQEARQNCGFDSSRNKWIVGSWSLLCQGLRRRRKESACKRRWIKTSLVVLMLLLRVMTYAVFNKLFWNWICVVRFVSHEVWSDEGFVISHFLHWCF